VPHKLRFITHMSEQVDLLDCLNAVKVEGQFDFVGDFDIDDSMDDEMETSVSVIRDPVEELSDGADSPILNLGISLTENGKLLLESNDIPVPILQKTRLQGPVNSNILDMGFDSTGKMEVADRNLFILDLSYKMDEPDSEELEVFSCLNDQLLPKCGFQLLRVLILRNNRLSSLANMHLAEMPFLTDLDLAHNSLTGTVPIGSFPPTLQRLDLSGNYLDGIAGLICCLSLLSLDVSSNSLRSISALPPRLKELDVSHNKLTSLTNLRLLSLSPSIISLNIAGNPAAEPYAPFRATVCSLLLKLEKLDGVYLPGKKFKNNRSPAKKIPETEVHRKGGLSKRQQEEADVLRHEEHSRRQLDVREKRARINENIDLLVRSPCSNSNYSPSHALISYSPDKIESFGRFSPDTISRKAGGGQIPVPRLLGFGAVLKKQQEESDKLKFNVHTKKKIEVIAKKMKNKSKEQSATSGSPRSSESCVSPSQRAQQESDMRRYEEHARRAALAQEKMARENEEIDSKCNSPRSRSASPTRKEQAEGDAIRHEQHLRRQLEVIVKREEINEAIDCLSNSPRSRAVSPSREAQQRADKERADAYLHKESHIQERLEELQSVSGHSDFKRGVSSSNRNNNHNHNSNSNKSVVSRLTNASTITSQKSEKSSKSKPKAVVHVHTIPQVPPLAITKAPVATEIPIPVQVPLKSEPISTSTTTSFTDTLPQGYKATLSGERNNTSGITDPRSEIIGNAMYIVNKGMNNGIGIGGLKPPVCVTIDIPRPKFESNDSRECGSYLDSASDITFHPPLQTQTQPGVTAASSKETEGEESFDESTVADSATEEGKYYVGERVIAEVEAAIQKNNDILLKLVHEIRGSMGKKPKGLRKSRDRKRSRGARDVPGNASNICHSMPPVFPPSTLLPSASSSISDEDNQFRDRQRKNASSFSSTAGDKMLHKSSEKSLRSARAEKAVNMFEKRGPRRSSIPAMPVKNERNERERIDQIPPGDHDEAHGKSFISSPSIEEKGQEEGEGERDVDHVVLEYSVVSNSHTDSVAGASVASWAAHSDISSIALPRKKPQVDCLRLFKISILLSHCILICLSFLLFCILFDDVFYLKFDSPPDSRCVAFCLSLLLTDAKSNSQARRGESSELASIDRQQPYT
jgi:hypothetical protein